MNQERFDQTIAKFDTLNAQDPNAISLEGKPQAKELVYALRMSLMLDKYAPDASEALKLAARCQHIQRWKKPRSDYPMTKPGYMQWRGNLKQFHAEVATKILTEQNYDRATILKVSGLLKKENLQSDADTQTLEDVIVMVFLAYDLDNFVQKHNDYTEKKLMIILRKSYLKMTAKGRKAVLTLINPPAHLQSILQKAIL